MNHFRRNYGSVDVKIEQKFKVFSRNRPAFEFGNIQTERRDFGHERIECTRAVRQREHQADLIGTGENPQILGDADEAGEIAVAVLNVIGKNGKSVKFRAFMRGNCGDVFSVGIGDHFCGCSRVFANCNFDISQLF